MTEKNPAVSPIRDDRLVPHEEVCACEEKKRTALEWILGGFVFPGKIAPPDKPEPEPDKGGVR